MEEALEEWRFPRDQDEMVGGAGCAVPLDATPIRARIALELNGTWVRRAAVVSALGYRRTRLVSAVSGQDT
ncbi:hypothetical protein [Micromonospora sp. CPCC 205739]|uniref:hypothetical protein n=1 Tax=Micromonospora sp. CPCC 205739 TaxID=3122404 RepID=UPI002FF40D55